LLIGFVRQAGKTGKNVSAADFAAAGDSIAAQPFRSKKEIKIL
jgi:hypothetical protein